MWKCSASIIFITNKPKALPLLMTHLLTMLFNLAISLNLIIGKQIPKGAIIIKLLRFFSMLAISHIFYANFVTFI